MDARRLDEMEGRFVMTREDYEKAKDIIIALDALKLEISDIKDIIRNDLTTWRMEVRASRSCPLRSVDPCGMLPEFMEAILSKKLARKVELEKELERL